MAHQPAAPLRGRLLSSFALLLLVSFAAPCHALALRSVGTGRCVSARRHVDVSLKLSRTGKKAEEQTSGKLRDMIMENSMSDDPSGGLFPDDMAATDGNMPSVDSYATKRGRDAWGKGDKKPKAANRAARRAGEPPPKPPSLFPE